MLKHLRAVAVAVVVFSSGAGVLQAANISRLQYKSGSSSPSASLTVTLPNATGAGHQLIVAVSDYYSFSADGESFSISDSYSNTWRKAVDYQPGGRLIVYYAENIAGGPNHQITVSAAPQGAYYIVTAVEYAGLASSNSLDVVATNRNNSISYTSTSAATSQGSELLFGLHHVWNTTTVLTPASPWTQLETKSDGAFHELSTQDQIVSSAGSYASTGTESSSSDTISVMVAFKAATGSISDTTPPTVPTNLTATAASATAINLTWTASTDNVGVTGYKVYQGGGQIATVTAGTSYQNTGLTPSTTYTYTVAAFDAAGNVSAPSVAASASTPSATQGDTTPPTVPTNLTATAASATAINLTWTASTDNVGVTGYKVYQGGGQIATVTAGTGYQNTGLAPSTTYTYTVAAFDAAGNVSAQSAAASATTQGGTGSSTTRSVSWTEMTPTTGWPGYNGYLTIKYDPTSQQTILYGVLSNSISIWSSDLFSYNSSSNIWTYLGGNGTLTLTCPADTPTWPGNRHPVGQWAVDTKRNLVWLFGGVCAERNRLDMYYLTLQPNPLNDTWTQALPNTIPLANNSSAMVYDPDDDVLFAWGYDGAAGLHDHWVYCRTAENSLPGILTAQQSAAGCVNPDDWNEVFPAGGIQPAGWTFPAMVYDVVTKKAILFGGANGQFQNQTWAYDIPTQQWTQKALSTTPPPPYVGKGSGLPALAYNTTTHKVLFHQTTNTGAPADWQYDPVADSWTTLSSLGGGAVTSSDVALAYDAKNDLLVSFSPTVYGADIWLGKLAASAPSVPANLSASVVSSSQVNLSWSASTDTDNVAIAGYNIYRNGVQVATSATNSYHDINLTPSTSYTYAVSAYDTFNVQSPQSPSVNVTTLATGGGGSSISRLQFKSASAAPGTSRILTLPNATVSGNELIVAVADYYANSADGENFSISDSYHNTWSKAVDYQPGGRLIVYYAENIAGGANHQITVTATSPGAYYLATVVEYAGLATTNSFDVVSVNTSVGNSYTSTSATITQGNELLFGLNHVWSPSATFTPTNSWSLIETKSDGIFHEQSTQDQIVSSVGTYASVGTESSFNTTISVMVTFRAAH